MADLKTLRRGAVGPQTELAQLALYRAGYDPAIDGVFGGQTQRAVVRFQRSAGLVADGVVGPRTWAALDPYLTGYTVHTVTRGDTLWSIARAHGTTVAAIETANPGTDPLDLRIGRRLTVPLGFDVVPANISFTSTVLELSVRGLLARYPFLRTGSAGASVMGRPVTWLSMGGGSRDVFYNASHHANEWITTPLLMRFLEDWASAYAEGSRIYGVPAADLYDGVTLYMIPMVNPDGVDLVTGEISSGRWYEGARAIAADYPSIPFPAGWKANISGTDPNLQYPAGWERAREIKFAQGFTTPAPRDYVGPSPLSAPESRAVYDFSVARDFSLTLSYHTQGRVIYWRFSDIEPEGARQIAARFAEASGYEVADVPYESGFAGYKDWFIQTYERPGYTIEAGSGASPLPLSQFGEIYRDNLGILTLGLQLY